VAYLLNEIATYITLRRDKGRQKKIEVTRYLDDGSCMVRKRKNIFPGRELTLSLQLKIWGDEGENVFSGGLKEYSVRGSEAFRGTGLNFT